MPGISSLSGTRAAARYVGRGPTGVGSLYSERRLYDLTAEVLEMKRLYAPMLAILYNKSKRLGVSDPEPKYLMSAPDEGIFTPSASQAYAAQADSFTLNFGTTNIRLIRPEDQFMVNGIFFRPSATLHAGDWNTSPTGTNNDSDTIGFAPETIRIISVNVVAGTASIARGDGFDVSVCNNAATGNYARITTSMRLIRTGSAFAENSSYPLAKSIDLDIEQMYNGIMKKTYGMSRTQLQTTERLGTGKQELQRRRSICDEELVTEMNRCLYVGRMGKNVDASGNDRRASGGMFEYIAHYSGNLGDGLNKCFDMNNNPLQINGDYTAGGLMELGEKIATYGSKLDRWAPAGAGLMTRLNEMFLGNFTINDELTGKLNFNVTDLVLGALTLHFVHDPTLTMFSHDANGYTAMKNMFCVFDILYMGIMFLQGITHEDVTAPGTDGTLWQALVEWGIIRKFPDAHSIIYNIGR